MKAEEVLARHRNKVKYGIKKIMDRSVTNDVEFEKVDTARDLENWLFF